MRKALCILAVAVFSLGLFSCESDNGAEDQALYEMASDKNSGDDR